MDDIAAILKRPYCRVVIPDEDSFYAEIVEFTGCLAVGDSLGDALSNLERVAESWLEASIELGHIIPEPLGCEGFAKMKGPVSYRAKLRTAPTA